MPLKVNSLISSSCDNLPRHGYSKEALPMIDGCKASLELTMLGAWVGVRLAS